MPTGEVELLHPEVEPASRPPEPAAPPSSWGAGETAPSSGAGETAPAASDSESDGLRIAPGSECILCGGGNVSEDASWTYRLVDFLPERERGRFREGSVLHSPVSISRLLLAHRVHAYAMQLLAKECLNNALAFSGHPTEENLFLAARSACREKLITRGEFHFFVGLNEDMNVGKHGEKRKR